MTEQPRPLVGVAAHIFFEGKILLSRRVSKIGEGTWAPAGGHVEFGETWEACALRESLEETGLTVKNPKLFATTQEVYPDLNKHYVTLHVAVEASSADFINAEPHKHLDMGWFSLKDLPSPMFPSVQDLLEQKINIPYGEQ